METALCGAATQCHIHDAMWLVSPVNFTIQDIKDVSSGAIMTICA